LYSECLITAEIKVPKISFSGWAMNIVIKIINLDRKLLTPSFPQMFNICGEVGKRYKLIMVLCSGHEWLLTDSTGAKYFTVITH